MKWGNIIIYFLHTKLRQKPTAVNICSDGNLSTNFCITSGDNFTKNSILGMYNFSVTYDYYSNLGIKSFDDKGSEILVNIGIVNDAFGSEEYFNAYWNEKLGIFGFGSQDGISYLLQ